MCRGSFKGSYEGSFKGISIRGSFKGSVGLSRFVYQALESHALDMSDAEEEEDQDNYLGSSLH